MEIMSLLQSFGVDQEGRLVSVEEVCRGKACECCCPGCGEVLIARQGEVRAWHFAHASDGDCVGAAEGALHRAAKQLIVQEGAILVPGLEVKEKHRLDDGRLGESALGRPPETWTLTAAREEVTVGDYRIDVAGTHDGSPVFIEVAVTHAVEDSKREALSRLGVHCFEIKLDPYQYESWTWTSLRQEILECIGNRDWIFHPDAADLAEQARCEAIAKAFEKPIPAAAPERIRFRVSEVPVHVTDRTWALHLWWPYNERVNPMLKAIAKSHGGRYNPQYRNWVIPVSAKAAVLEQLNGIGAVREN
ncbi:competence protein CoiA family protein [uncultured Thiodictyon sp.]|uniref:competence protein CoiA family protein n=1 Tax=uncultured Thiodictyon sp. TaxID=1846217 RepID=UPI0025E8B001|nr:competence protein CoiA family protein [uncultured Thiodictyon sp.]